MAASDPVAAEAVDVGRAAPRRIHDRLDRVAIPTLVVLSALWGFNQVTVKVANAGLQPVFQAGLRSLIACALVFAWCAIRRIPLFERDGTLPGGMLAGILFAAEFLLIYVGLDYTGVSRSVIFVYIMPFIVAVGAHLLLPNEKLTQVKVIGLLAAFGGLAFAFSDALSLPSREELFGDLLCLGAAFMWGGTTLVIKRTKLIEASPEKVLLYQLAVSAAVLLVAAPLFGPLVREPTTATFAALGFQSVIVVSISYLVWFWLLRSYPAADLSTYTFLTPVFGLISGALFLQEPIGPKLVAALGLIAFGIWLVSQRRFGAPRSAK